MQLLNAQVKNSNPVVNGQQGKGNLLSQSTPIRHAIALLIGLLALSSVVGIVYYHSHRHHTGEPPTYFRLMGARYDGLTMAAEGFDRSGVQLIGYDGEKIL